MSDQSPIDGGLSREERFDLRQAVERVTIDLREAAERALADGTGVVTVPQHVAGLAAQVLALYLAHLDGRISEENAAAGGGTRPENG